MTNLDPNHDSSHPVSPVYSTSVDLGRWNKMDTFTYAGLTLTLKELQSLFRYEKMRRAAVMKEMKRMANIVANRGGKKDPVFTKPVKTQGPRKTVLPNPTEVADLIPLIPSSRRWNNLYIRKSLK